jgi:hypothetical protein
MEDRMVAPFFRTGVDRRWFLLVAAVACVGYGAYVRTRTPLVIGINGRVAPYGFPLSSRGDPLAELSFYQDRVLTRPGSGLDLAYLARQYLHRARATGDARWYLLASQAARRSLAILPVSNEGAVLTLARVADASHDFLVARALAQQVLAAHPRSGEAQGLLITTAVAMGQGSSAEGMADGLMKRSPSLASAALQALVRSATGRDAQAEADLSRGLKLEEFGEVAASAWARVLLGRIRARHGDWAAAEDLYRTALYIVPDHTAALFHLAGLKLAHGQWDAAEALYERGKSAGSAFTLGRARAAALAGATERAQSLEREAEQNLRHDLAGGGYGHRRDLANLLLARPDRAGWEEALALMNQELAVRQDALTYDTLAWAHANLGHWDEARAASDHALATGLEEPGLLERAITIANAQKDAPRVKALQAKREALCPGYPHQAGVAIDAPGGM